MILEWVPIAVLPNIELQKAIGCNFAALAPSHDNRIANLKRAHPSFCKFLRSFSDNFGERFEPSVLIINGSLSENFRHVEAISSFRNAIALSVTTYARARQILSDGWKHTVFGDAFAIYPWMLDKDYDDLISITPAHQGTQMVSCFKGQSSPSLPRSPVDDSDIDQPLLEALLERWCQHFESNEPEWKNIALMRSLNMAYHASLMPAGMEATFYDIGRLIALWVSAFEILVHPGTEGDNSNKFKVFKLLEGAHWLEETHNDPIYKTGKMQNDKRIFFCWLLEKLYNLRNDFLHGNDVKSTKLLINHKRLISDYASPLYRIALTSFLQLKYDIPYPSLEDAETVADFINNRMTFKRPQQLAEEALLTAKPISPAEAAS